MGGRFRRKGSGYSTKLAPGESALLAHLARELVGLLDSREQDLPRPLDPLEELTGLVDGPIPAPHDPVLARLLPDAYGDDTGGAEEFRRHTELDLREGKRANAERLVASLPEAGGTVVLDEEGAMTWLTALTDLRLLLGVRLGVSEDTAAEMRHMRRDDPRLPGLEVYSWLSYIQETLVGALGDPTASG